MTVKRKISIRKILQVFTTLVVSVGCIIAMVSASRIADKDTIKNISIHIKNDKKYHFIEQQEIMDLAINNRQVDVEHTPLSKLDIHSMEQVILADPWVANAEVYITNDHTLNIYITQRIPAVRIFQQNGMSYYMDTTLSIMPLSSNYVYYTSVVTNVPEIKNDSLSWELRRQIVSLARIIQSDTFWNAQISEAILDSPGMFELTPVLGDQRIILGDLTRVNDKLNNLFIFYKNVLNRIGWDKYETLDLRFKGQVVATPSLPYTGPVDKAVANMNWINSIVETEARNDAKDSVNIDDNAADTKDDKDVVVNKKDIVKPNKPVAAIQKVNSKPGNNKKNDKRTPKYILQDKKN